MSIEPYQGNGITRAPQAGMTARDEFGAQELSIAAETASSAVAAQARAQIEARYVMAVKRPRDWDDVRVKLLKECKRPSFAAVAIYRKPVGRGIEGPSIRFAETAMRCMGNILPEAATIYDDPAKRIVRVTVTDLESNLTYSKDVTIDKTVERSAPKDGQQVLGVRTNSQGRKTYLVAATDDDLLNKEGALVSKAIRVNGLRLIPGDLIDEALWTVRETLSKSDAEDPDTARNRIVDGFASLNVMPSDLKTYLGHDIGTASPAELGALRGLFAAIRDNETTWQVALDAKIGKDDEKKSDTASGSKTDALKAKLAAEKPATPAPAQPKEGTPQPDDTGNSEGEPPAGALKSDHEPSDKRVPNNGVGKTARVDFVKDAGAWAAHLATLDDENEVAREYHSRSSTFNRANVKDARRAAVVAEILRREPQCDPEKVLAR